MVPGRGPIDFVKRIGNIHPDIGQSVLVLVESMGNSEEAGAFPQIGIHPLNEGGAGRTIGAVVSPFGWAAYFFAYKCANRRIKKRYYTNANKYYQDEAR